MSEGKRNLVYSFLGRRWVRKDIFEKALKGGINNWQPIETAPKDGSALLIYEPLEGFPRLKEGFGPSDSLCVGIARWHSPDYEPDHWGDAFEPWEKLMQSPTHWMPLPKVPE